MWRQIALPLPMWERILAFSVSPDSELVVASHDGIFRIDLRAPTAFTEEDMDEHDDIFTVFNRQTNMLSLGARRYQMLGDYGGTPTERSAQGEVLLLEPTGDILRVQDSQRNMLLEFAFTNFSGDWQYATFSRDGKYVVLGMPYDIYAFQRE